MTTWAAHANDDERTCLPEEQDGLQRRQLSCLLSVLCRIISWRWRTLHESLARVQDCFEITPLTRSTQKAKRGGAGGTCHGI